MKGYAILFISLICVISACGCVNLPSGQKQVTSTPQITTRVPTGPAVTVLIKARAFDPDYLQISPGTTVIWTNEDPMIHRVVHLPEAAQAQLFDSGPLSSGQSFRYTFYEKGRYNYGDPQIGGGRSPLIIVE